MRVPELDGVRGLAAMVVLMHHALLVLPWGARAYYETGAPGAGVDHWLTYSPLHLFWVGPEAVLLFFVLSGVVVSLPFLQGPRRPTWREYYPSRLVRLYLPVAGSVAIAVVWYLLVPRDADGDDSAWIQTHDAPLTPAVVARTLVLLDGTDVFNSPLWSLQWEVWFSLLLPLYVLFAGVGRLRWVNPVAVLVVLVLADARPQYTEVVYLASFAAGACLAVFVSELRGVRLSRGVGWAALGLVVLAMTWRWTTIGLGQVGLSRWWPTAAVVGSTLLLALAITWPPARRFFASRALLWCGAVSFSLYLVHEPIIVSLAHLAPAGLLWLVPVVGVGVSIPFAMMFLRWVEAPSHRLAKRWRRRVADRARSGVPSAAPLNGPGGA